MQNSMIYHGGGMGKGGGFYPGSTPAPTIDSIRIWVNVSDLSALTAKPPNGPSTRVLPNTMNARVWIFTPSELDLAFCHIPIPNEYWTYKVTAPTDCNLRLYWYTDLTSANIICWRAELNFIRNLETLNFALPFLNDINRAANTQYQLQVSESLNFPINNPSGSAAETEGLFYFKVGRDGANAADTFANEAYLLGASIDLPIS